MQGKLAGLQIEALCTLPGDSAAYRYRLCIQVVALISFWQSNPQMITSHEGTQTCSANAKFISNRKLNPSTTLGFYTYIPASLSSGLSSGGGAVATSQGSGGPN